eukprot:g13337.t1
MGAFLLLDASDRAITLCWEREPDVSVECVQMRVCATDDQKQEGGGGEQQAEVAPSSGGGDRGGEAKADADGDDWVTLSETLGSSALKKNKLTPGTAYVFRRRARKQAEWGAWSPASEPFRTLSEGMKQPEAPAVKLCEAGALVMEWPAVTTATGYEVQMSTSGGEWTTLAASFGSTLLRKKGLDKSKQYRFRVRPVFGDGGAKKEVGDEDEWGWSPASALASPAVLNAFLSSQMPGKLVGKGKASLSRDVLAGKIVAFYFSASWCGPCRAYTPKLAALYNRAKAQHKAFEVVFVSLDGDEDSMHRYHAGMPWPAVPYEEPFREDFASSKGVNSVPRLIVTGRRGQELASNAVGMTWEQLCVKVSSSAMKFETTFDNKVFDEKDVAESKTHTKMNFRCPVMIDNIFSAPTPTQVEVLDESRSSKRTPFDQLPRGEKLAWTESFHKTLMGFIRTSGPRPGPEVREVGIPAERMRVEPAVPRPRGEAGERQAEAEPGPEDRLAPNHCLEVAGDTATPLDSSKQAGAETEKNKARWKWTTAVVEVEDSMFHPWSLSQQVR